MELYQIILLILVLLLFIYVSVVIYVLSHVVHFSNKRKQRLRALDILLSEKALQLLTIKDEFERMGISFSKADEDIFWNLSVLKFEKSTYESVSSNRQIVSLAEKRISFLSLSHHSIETNKVYNDSKATLEDLDKNFRRCSVLYNSDLNAYNYWIAIPGTRVFCWMFRFRKGKTMG